jgi:very-short-patch-repair endonuclease
VSNDTKRAAPPPPLRGRSDREAIREGGMPPQAHRPVTPLNRSRAKSMRAEMTEAERALWMQLHAHRLDGLRFRRQAPIGQYIVDFVCHECRLIVELDGGQHAESQRDVTRDRWLESKGYRVLRFWNSDLFKNRESVLETIVSTARTPPASPLEGEVGAAQQRREGGRPQAPELGANPPPGPPPQGGREQTCARGSLGHNTTSRAPAARRSSRPPPRPY